MPEAKKFCPRCGRPGVRVSHPTDEVWNCPTKHGEIFRAQLKGVELQAPAPAKIEKPSGRRTRVA